MNLLLHARFHQSWQTAFGRSEHKYVKRDPAFTVNSVDPFRFEIPIESYMRGNYASRRANLTKSGVRNNNFIHTLLLRLKNYCLFPVISCSDLNHYREVVYFFSRVCRMRVHFCKSPMKYLFTAITIRRC